MDIPEIFLQAFWQLWPVSCGAAVGLLIGLVGRLASNGGGTFIAPPESFPELAAFTEDHQLRLLREACRDSFRALSFVPLLIFLAFLWVGPVLSLTLQKVTGLPILVHVVLSLLLIGLGYWLARYLEAHRVSPFVKKRIGL